MEVTPEHPIYVEGKGWLWAENLSIGDRLRRSDGGMARVLAIERVELAGPEVVYNFTVKGPHTYFVLEAGVLVHNDRSYPGCAPVPDPRVKTGFRDPQTGRIARSPYKRRIYYPREEYDPRLTEEIFKVLEQTEEGKVIISKVKALKGRIRDPNERLLIAFTDRTDFTQGGILGEYSGTTDHYLLLNKAVRQAPPEVLAPTLAHELSHRLRRWEFGSLEDEILAHRTGARVWQELKKFEGVSLESKLATLPSNIRAEAIDMIRAHDEVVEASRTLDDEAFGLWLRNRSPRYENLPENRRSVFVPEDYDFDENEWFAIGMRFRQRIKYGP